MLNKHCNKLPGYLSEKAPDTKICAVLMLTKIKFSNDRRKASQVGEFSIGNSTIQVSRTLPLTPSHDSKFSWKPQAKCKRVVHAIYIIIWVFLINTTCITTCKTSPAELFPVTNICEIICSLLMAGKWSQHVILNVLGERNVIGAVSNLKPK